MPYVRVIPRDLFNEAKLLKCLGQLSLILHDGKGVRWPLRLEHSEPETGFQIEQDSSNGGLFCANLRLLFRDEQIDLRSCLNSHSPYPLVYTDLDGEEGEVFNNDGSLSDEFTDWLDKEVD